MGPLTFPPCTSFLLVYPSYPHIHPSLLGLPEYKVQVTRPPALQPGPTEKCILALCPTQSWQVFIVSDV